MNSIFDAARYVLEKTGPVTTMKLHKLLYYAQAWSLVWEDSELFPEDFEAWAGGPVCPELFEWHRETFKVGAQDVPADRLSGAGFTREQKETMDMVIRDYGQYSSAQLVELSRYEDPWIIARNGVGAGAPCSAVIPKARMARYYSWIL